MRQAHPGAAPFGQREGGAIRCGRAGRSAPVPLRVAGGVELLQPESTPLVPQADEAAIAGRRREHGGGRAVGKDAAARAPRKTAVRRDLDGGGGGAGEQGDDRVAVGIDRQIGEVARPCGRHAIVRPQLAAGRVQPLHAHRRGRILAGDVEAAIGGRHHARAALAPGPVRYDQVARRIRRPLRVRRRAGQRPDTHQHSTDRSPAGNA
jgi:hypothetical protein